MKSEKTVSCSSNGIIVYYGDNNKHQFVNYESRNGYIRQIQLSGNNKYQQKVFTEFTSLQKDLYCKALYGFSAYTKQELDTMSKNKRFSIKINYTKANRLLNRWKQEIINEFVDGLFMKFFPKSPVTKQMANVKGYDDNLSVDISFKDLGISKEKIAAKLVEFGILPNNFFQLN